jgi:hypothetical protein
VCYSRKIGNKMNQKLLLIEPEFPIPPKSKNHSNFLPIGLLKLAAYYRNKGAFVYLIHGNMAAPFYPTDIFITSLFTYWAENVKESVQFYKTLYPNAKIVVGGIYATLLPDHCKEFTGCDQVFIGQHKNAENCRPAYDLVNVDYQIIHGMRGCTRKCPFCGIWKIEDLSFKTMDQIRKEIFKRRIVFYDNNMLINPDIINILKMLSGLKFKNLPIRCECQSGFDGRIIEEKPELATLLKQARFENIRIAWDFDFAAYSCIEKWIKIFENAGFRRQDIFVFMIYNWSFDYNEMENKRKKCFEWGVQIADCRFRPLNQTFDNYNSNIKNQTCKDYYIHSNWSDEQIRGFRKNVRKHNVCVRYKIPWDIYSHELERINSKKRLNESTYVKKLNNSLS